MFKALTIPSLYNLSNDQLNTNCKKEEKSKTSSRVEHIFGFIENSMNGFIITISDYKRYF